MSAHRVLHRVLALTFTVATTATVSFPGTSPAQAAQPNHSLTYAAISDQTQQERDALGRRRWENYKERLQAAGVTPPPASALTNPGKTLPDGFSPLIRNNKVVLGVATVPVGDRTLIVLPQETVTTITAAFTNLGKPYALGTRGPNTYDCGRYTRSMFTTANVYLGSGRPNGQYRKNRVVRHRHKQIGDLLFAGDPSTGFHHVGINLGRGLMLAADGATGAVAVIPSATTTAAARPTLPQPTVANTTAQHTSSTYCGASAVITAPVKKLVWPLPEGTYRFSAVYGQKGTYWSKGYHTGLDFAAPTGTPVYAPAGGVVRLRSDQGWAGPNFVQIDHGNGIVTWYAHMSTATVRDGQTVVAGQQLGKVGSLGNSTGPHLHFETHTGSSLSPYVNGPDVNPLPYLDGTKPWPALVKPSLTQWGGIRL